MSLKQGIYEHYRGNLYQVIGLARHEETLEEMVVYQALYGDYGLWVRPLALFASTVEVEHQTLPRFKFLRESFQTPPHIK